VVALELNRANAHELFMTQPDVTFAIMEGLCRQLDAVTASYRSLHSEKNEVDAIGLKVSGNSPIFPEGHGNYILRIDNQTPDILYNENLQCPICGNKFSQLTVLVSKLVQESKDPDQRVRFKDVEPMYYEIITCPKCLYSAMADLFKDIEVTKRMIEALSNVMAPHVGSMEIRIGTARDTFTIFAGYYLAIMCAPVCFYEHQRITARLWRNLSRIYDDCSDEKMAHYALQRAHDEYMFSYSNFDINGKSLQQLCYVIGELKYKLQDVDHARQFFYAAFTNRDGNPAVKRQAEDKLEEIKSILSARQKTAQVPG
jgi:uncharacterized protein (DUF2225 family)